jgi:hypothetical protein
VLALRSDGIISANEQFTEWLRGNKTMPFGDNYHHVPVRLIDFDNLDNNQYIVTSQYTYRAGATEKRPDLVLLVNGLPLVIIEAKTPVRQIVADGVHRPEAAHDPPTTRVAAKPPLRNCSKKSATSKPPSWSSASSTISMKSFALSALMGGKVPALASGKFGKPCEKPY